MLVLDGDPDCLASVCLMALYAVEIFCVLFVITMNGSDYCLRRIYITLVGGDICKFVYLIFLVFGMFMYEVKCMTFG